jgi:hypothetical protein
VPATLETADAKDELVSTAEAALARMLASPHFARAETQRKLLQYLWDRRHEVINEYAIAVDALGRTSSFDPNSDASVRVHISRLRRKLKDYYAETGEPELLAIPSGTYHLSVLEANLAPAPALPEVSAELVLPELRERSLRARLIPLLAALCGVLFLALSTCVVLLVRRNMAADAVPPRPKPNAFWTNFLAGSGPVKIVLPTPTFLNFRDHPSLKIRSTKVNSFDEVGSDPDLKQITDRLGPFGLEQSYTVTWDTLAAIEIVRYLDRVSPGQQVSFEVTRDASQLSLEEANVIVLGTDHTLRPVREYTDSMNFSLTDGEDQVLNAHPAPGEQRAYLRQMQGRERHVEPSIIAVLPGHATGYKLLMLESRDTSGMVSLLASNTGSYAVQEMWHKHGAPRFFEMVVMTEMQGQKPLRSWPVALHAYPDTPPAKTM